MKHRVLIDGEPVVIPDGGYSLERVEPGVWSVLIGGQSYEVRIDGGEARVNARSFAVQIEDPRELSGQTAVEGSGGRREVKAPMTGRVVSVLVKEGEEVEAREGLVVVEAMKMQNAVPSPKAGRVVSINVAPGDAVVRGQLLAVIE